MPHADRVDLVVVGLGYVGLPLAAEATRAGLSVVGLDIDAQRVAALAGGRSHVDDLTDDDVADLLARGFVPTDDAAVLARADTVVICVPTPLTAVGGPDLGAVDRAVETVGAHLHAGQLVVLESTTYPGTTEDRLLPYLQDASGLKAGPDFHLAFSPERIDPGNQVYGIRNTPKVVGGVTEECGDRAVAFYGRFIDKVVRTRGTREAEMAKLLENTYRHVNIALVNEMAVFCHDLGIDLWDVIDAAATKPFGFQPFRPGPGVGGHCIPIDPNYLSFRVRQLGYPFRFVELAQEINERMPAYVTSRAQRLLNDQGKAVKDARILLLGVTYKPDISDDRESPARPVARRLKELGAEVRFHDPYVPAWRVDGVHLERRDLTRALPGADLVIVLQAHASYDPDLITRLSPLVLDTSGTLSGPRVERL
jgi:nucleotide sugar dehydrogenase